MDAAGIDAECKAQILALLARKASSELTQFLTGFPDVQRETIALLASMHGDRDVLERARAAFADIDGVDAVLTDIATALACCDRIGCKVNVYIDLTEAHGYRYH